MTESERRSRNAERLAECHPGFRELCGAVIVAMETAGWRPRIQDAWRSPVDQLKRFREGTSKVEWGFHNVETYRDQRGGILLPPNKESLAADILNDDDQVWPNDWQKMPSDNTKRIERVRFALDLARSAGKVGLRTGILWGLDMRQTAAVQAALADGTGTPVIGWDPLHVEIRGITLAEAKAGKRPPITMAPGGGGTAPAAVQPPDGGNRPEPATHTPDPPQQGGSLQTAASGGTSETDPASSLSDAVRRTQAMPPFPTPEAIGDYQLSPWLKRLREELAASGGLNTLSQEVREYLESHFPRYLALATRQRILTAGAEAGITDVAAAWNYWRRMYGFPLLEADRQLEWWITQVRR